MPRRDVGGGSVMRVVTGRDGGCEGGCDTRGVGEGGSCHRQERSEVPAQGTVTKDSDEQLRQAWQTLGKGGGGVKITINITTAITIVFVFCFYFVFAFVVIVIVTSHK